MPYGQGRGGRGGRWYGAGPYNPFPGGNRAGGETSNDINSAEAPSEPQYDPWNCAPPPPPWAYHPGGWGPWGCPPGGAAYGAPYYQPNPEEEKNFLHNRARFLEQELEQIHRRLEELGGGQGQQ